MADACFQIKGTTVATVVLDIHQYRPDAFSQQLQEKIKSAPRLFSGTPLYVELASCRPALNGEQLAQLIACCRELDLQPFGCRGASDALLPTLQQLGLTLLPQTRTWESRITQEANAAASPASDSAPAPVDTPSPAAAPTPALSASTKVIHRPVRSGQQVYAKGGDLILLAPVSEGAEIIADGNIHVYSTLRGRALAGVNDNPDARIFCQQLEAELVSIAGHFVLNDTLRNHCWKQAAQIYLEDESLQIAAL